MKVTYNWLKDFVDINISAKKLAEKLTIAGLEVVSLEKKESDFIFEIEITSNRPDWLSVIGIAREVASITGKKIKIDYSPSITKKDIHKKSSNNQLKCDIIITDKNDCPLYSANIIKNIRVVSSPGWLKKRLESVGIRSVNSVVDITNYILLETGQPLHAFDADKVFGLSGNNRSVDVSIGVRRAGNKEEIVTIDGIKRVLDSDILVIASGADKTGKNHSSGKIATPIAIAGIMGGIDTEVSIETENIILEAAVFNPVITRRASRKLSLSSESSYRFERGIDCQSVEFASMRAVNLILELCAGKFFGTLTSGQRKYKRKIIVLKTEYVNSILGGNYSVKQITQALKSLSFTVNTAEKKAYAKTKSFLDVKGMMLKVGIPSFRSDIIQPIDLVEEAARVFGYDNIPAKLPRIVPQVKNSDTIWEMVGKVRDILVSQGVKEVITYSLISRNMAKIFGYSDAQLTTVVNPLSIQQEILSPCPIPRLVSCIKYNFNQKQKDIRIFEICNKFDEEGSNNERLTLAMALAGEDIYLKECHSVSKAVNLLYVKGVIEVLLDRLGLADFEFSELQAPHLFFQQKVSVSLKLKGKIIGYFGMIKQEILKNLDMDSFVFASEIDLVEILSEAVKIEKKFTPIPVYPEVIRDVSLVLKQDASVGGLIKEIKDSSIPYLEDLKVRDIYSGQQISAGHKGITLSCFYRAKDHTLTAQEVNDTHQQIISILERDKQNDQKLFGVIDIR